MTEQLTEEQAPHDQPVAAPAGPARVTWASVPKVNLLPIEIIQGRRLARLKLLLGGVVVAGCLVAAGGTYLAQRQVSAANDDLTVAQSEVTTLQSQAAKYSAVPQVTSQLEAATTARAQVMGQDVLWYQFLNDLAGALPSGVSQQTITATLTPATTGQATAANPLSVAGIGTLTIAGKAAQYQDVASWLEALAKISGVSTPALTSATKSDDPGGGETVTYTVGGVLTDDALSHRYDEKDN